MSFRRNSLNGLKVASFVVLSFLFVGCNSDNNGDSNSVPLKDGTYKATSTELSKTGYNDEVEIVVENSVIKSVNYNGYNEQGLDKKTESTGGSYDMSSAGSTVPWNEQAKLLEDKLIETQDINSIEVDSDGYTDSVAGVSIKADAFVELSNEALSQAAD